MLLLHYVQSARFYC